MGRDGDRSRIGELVRIGVDRLRLLADRELHAVGVEDRPSAGGDHDRLAMLTLGHPSERGGANALKPHCARKRRCEDEREDHEQQADAPVCLLVAHHFATFTYPYGSW